MTTNWPKDNEAELDAFYSRPDGSAKWEVTNLVYITCPWKIYVAGTKTEMTRGIRVHRKVADSLLAVLNEIWEYFGKSQAEIEKIDLHQIGGAYYFRARRGSSRLSNHARGIAIDIDPLDNPMRKGSRGDMPQVIIDIFNNAGWRWGGVYGDPMHFEAVWNGGVAKKVLKPFKSVEVLAPSKPVVPPAPKPLPPKARVVNDAAVNLVKEMEAFRATRYKDGARWAIGYGRNEGHRGFVITPDMVVTEAQASQMLRDDLTEVGIAISPFIKVPVNDNQFGAMCSLAYNIGTANFATSSILIKTNAGNPEGAANSFVLWNKATKVVDGVSKKVVLPGLTKRRLKEAELYKTPV